MPYSYKTVLSIVDMKRLYYNALEEGPVQRQ